MSAEFFCPDRIVCPGSDDPLANLTSEGFDRRRYFCIVHGETWRGPCCSYVCESEVSQEEADLCCQNREVLLANNYCYESLNLDGSLGCPTTDPVTGDPDACPACDPPQPRIYWNTEQTCGVYCPDGVGSFSYTVAAHLYSATSQEEADRIAYSIACRNALLLRFCIEPSLNRCCPNVPFFQNIGIVGGTPPFTWTIISGSVPAGMTFTQAGGDGRNWVLQGTPTTPGAMSLVLQVQDGSGRIFNGVLYLGVVGALPAQLPNATLGVPYSQQLSLVGVPPGTTASYSVLSGALPTGLSLSASGLISGTPTGGIPATFTVKVTTIP